MPFEKLADFRILQRHRRQLPADPSAFAARFNEDGLARGLRCLQGCGKVWPPINPPAVVVKGMRPGQQRRDGQREDEHGKQGEWILHDPDPKVRR